VNATQPAPPAERRPKTGLVAALAALAMLGLAQWFFGNLYEAVVTAPNWRVGFEYEALTGRSQNAGRAVRYYVPTTWIAAVLLWVATAMGWRSQPGARRWLAAASTASLTAVLLSVYIVIQLNMTLFLGPPVHDVDSVRPLMEEWQALNWGRVALVAIALATTAESLRRVDRSAVLESLAAGHPSRLGLHQQEGRERAWCKVNT
jgi:hypothetical protein